MSPEEPTPDPTPTAVIETTSPDVVSALTDLSTRLDTLLWVSVAVGVVTLLVLGILVVRAAW